MSESEVTALLRDLKPGTLYPASVLLDRHNRARHAADVDPSSPRALGLALRAAGWVPKIVRKSKGARKTRVVTEVSCWLVPGGPDPEAHVTVRQQIGAVRSRLR